MNSSNNTCSAFEIHHVKMAELEFLALRRDDASQPAANCSLIIFCMQVWGRIACPFTIKVGFRRQESQPSCYSASLSKIIRRRHS